MPLALAEPPVHYDPPPPQPQPELPVFDSDATIPLFFDIVWNLSAPTALSYFVVSESESETQFDLKVMTPQMVEVDSGTFAVTQRFELSGLSSVLDSAYAEAIPGTSNSDTDIHHAVFFAAGTITGSAGTRNCVMMGVSLEISKLQASPISRTFFYPVALRNTPALAIEFAGSLASRLDSAMRTDPECNLSAQELQQLSCLERCGYNFYCDNRSCESDYGIDLDAARQNAAIELGVCAAATITGPWTTLACCALVYAHLKISLMAADRRLANCRNDAIRNSNSCKASCDGTISEQ